MIATALALTTRLWASDAGPKALNVSLVEAIDPDDAFTRPMRDKQLVDSKRSS
jgi:hypothetical protein